MDGQGLTAILPILQSVMGLTSSASGLYNGYENAQQQNKIRGIVDNPSKMAAYTAGFKQPLAAGLEQGVANSAQGYAAERGLATSPAAEQSIYAQAIAPYIQQQQSEAQSAALQSHGLGMNQNQGHQEQVGGQLTSGLQQLMKLLSLGKGSGGFSPQQLPNGFGGPSAPPVPTDLTNWAGGGDSGMPDLSAIFGSSQPSPSYGS